MPDKSTEKLYHEILEEEVRLARSVAFSSRRVRPFSVWEVLIPIVFILGFMRSRQQRELFVQNFIFTKKMALQAAKEICSGALTQRQALDHVEKKTGKLIDSLDPTLYSVAIQQAQLDEIRLLMQHYSRLIQCAGGSLSESIRSVYPSREDYLGFVQQLRQAENNVSAAAIQTVGDRADRDMVARIEAQTQRIRLKAADRFYPPNHER